MKMLWSNIHFIILSVCLSICYTQIAAYTDSSDCKKLSVCSCQFSNGHIFDISYLRDKGPFVAKNENDVIYFYPCRNHIVVNELIKPSSECSQKPGVSLCLYEDQKNDKSKTIALGKVEEMTMNILNTLEVVFIFSHSKGINYTTFIYIQFCENQCQPVLYWDKSDPSDGSTKVYNLKMKIPKIKAEGLSTGSVLVIMFFVFGGLYFIGGALLIKFLRGATGWELLPNHSFWCDLPALVREGITFTFNRCQTDSYERI